MYFSKQTKLLIFITTSIFIIAIHAVFSIEDDKFIPATSILLSASFAGIAAFLSIRYSRQTARESNSLSFQQYLTDSKEYREHLIVVSELLNNTLEISVDKYGTEEYRRTPEAISIRYVLNTWERAGNAIIHRLYDENYLYTVHKSMVLDLGVRLRPYIKEVQKNNVSLYSNFNWLALKWAIRRDSFAERNTKLALKKVFSDLDKIRHGKIPSNKK